MHLPHRTGSLPPETGDHHRPPSTPGTGSRLALSFRPGVTGKLFLAILATCLVLALGIGFAFRLSFQHDFLDYVRQGNETRVEHLADDIARVYRQHGSWDFLRDAPDGWPQLLHTLAPVAERGEHSPASMPPGLRTRLWLLDTQGRVLGGHGTPPADDRLARPVTVDGHTVGWVLGTAQTRLTHLADVHFLERQRRAGWIITGLSVLLAAMVAVLLARGFLAPLKRLAGATHQLAAGDFTARVEAYRRDEFGQLAQDFNQLAQTLEQNESLRRHFMADVSHELRTPLAVLRGELEALEDGIRAPTPASLRSLQAEVATLSKLVDDLHLLSLSELGALSYRKTGVDAGELLELALDAFQQRLARRRIVVHRDWPAKGCRVFGDRERLHQLFNNLLENSVRYTDAGGRLDVRCRCDTAHVWIEFDDSAPGVPPAQLPLLFQRFRRLDSSRASDGSGLGLAICRNIVAAHDGEIVARASPLGGLGLTIRLPRLGAEKEDGALARARGAGRTEGERRR